MPSSILPVSFSLSLYTTFENFRYQYSILLNLTTTVQLHFCACNGVRGTPRESSHC